MEKKRWQFFVSILAGRRDIYIHRAKQEKARALLQKLAQEHDRSMSWAARYLTARYLGVEVVSDLDIVLHRESKRRRVTPNALVAEAIERAVDGEAVKGEAHEK